MHYFVLQVIKILIKTLKLFDRYLQRFSKMIVKSKLFSFIRTIVIFLNCCTYAILQNKTGEYSSYKSQISDFEYVFFLFYLLEMILKMIGSGLLFSRNSYFRNGWNILDFAVILSLMFIYSNTFSSIDVSFFKSLKILVPLKAVSGMRKIQLIITAFFNAIPLILDTLIILLFCYLFYALFGLQLFSGILKNRCMNLETGFNMIIQNTIKVCGNIDCLEVRFLI